MSTNAWSRKPHTGCAGSWRAIVALALLVTAGCGYEYGAGTDVVADYVQQFPRSIRGSASDCTPLCRTWVSTCMQLAVADNQGTITSWRAVGNVLKAQCNAKSTAGERVICVAKAQSDHDAHEETLKIDSAAAKAFCQNSTRSCRDFCKQNS